MTCKREKSSWGQFGGHNSSHTVHKMNLILHSIERIPKLQFSMARKFMLQPLRRHDVKINEKTCTVKFNRAASVTIQSKGFNMAWFLNNTETPDIYGTTNHGTFAASRFFFYLFRTATSST